MFTYLGEIAKIVKELEKVPKDIIEKVLTMGIDIFTKMFDEVIQETKTYAILYKKYLLENEVMEIAFQNMLDNVKRIESEEEYKIVKNTVINKTLKEILELVKDRIIVAKELDEYFERIEVDNETFLRIRDFIGLDRNECAILIDPINKITYFYFVTSDGKRKIEGFKYSFVDDKILYAILYRALRFFEVNGIIANYVNVYAIVHNKIYKVCCIALEQTINLLAFILSI